MHRLVFVVLIHAGRPAAMSVASTHGVNEPTVLEEREGGHYQLRFTNDE